MTDPNKTDWTKTIRRMEQLLRLKSFPVALKMLPEEADLDKIRFIRRPEGKATLCQLITQVRNFDWTVGASVDDFIFPACPSILGLRDTPEVNKDGTFRNIVWVQTKEDARRYEEAIPRLPLNKFQAVAMAPLVYNPFEPDMVLIYANPAQMIVLINALQFEDYQVMQFYCVGESSCSDAIARCYNTGKPALSIPCYGERRYGHAQDDELVIALPPELMPKALRGLETLYRKGVRYPISYAGAECDMEARFPPAYLNLEEMMGQVRGDGKRTLVGLTGSIACGKSAAAAMLEELGAPMIDFDVLARVVVEPGKPAFQDIVDYFGKQVVGQDGTLDRKKLSDIIFGDLEKRKKLEGFTHPRIYEEFFRLINEISEKDPEAIIQVVIPLLIEVNMQYLFDKLIVVAVSPRVQAERLAARDGISLEEASKIISSQLAIDEKKGYADYVIDNEGSLEETRAQVEKVWADLQDFSKTKNQSV